jgi:hypothetical protein
VGGVSNGRTCAEEDVVALLFSYGTLQQDDVQFAAFGRRLEGHRDELVGFEPTLVKIEDSALAAKVGKTHHANASRTDDAQSRVAGMTFEVSDAELAGVDAYERRFDYARIQAKLASGRTAWVYVHQPATGRGRAGSR